MLSPVSYSVASLIKRVWVILVAVLWFRSSTTPVQGAGIILTCFGLYLYDRTSMEDSAERRTKADHFRHKAALLPVTEVQTPGLEMAYPVFEEKNDTQWKRDDAKDRSHSPNFSSGWLAPGTKQETTWDVGGRGDKGRVQRSKVELYHHMKT